MLTKLKRKIRAKARPLTHRWFRGDEIAAVFKQLQVVPNKPLLVHSSLSAFGYVRDGGGSLVSAIRQAVNDDTTIAMPTHTWGQVSAGLRVVDMANTRSCVGAITETFRNQSSARRSLHPTHSLAIEGPSSMSLVADHELAETPCGFGTPYHRLLKLDAQILFLGAPLSSNTSYHCAEAIAGMDYLMSDSEDEFTILRVDGAPIQIRMRRHRRKVARCLSRLATDLTREGILKSSRTCGIECHIIKGLDFLYHTVSHLKADPTYLRPKK